MRVKVLASGSKGNCTFVECGNTKILIDAGISYTQIKMSLSEDDVDINDINYILITHSHSDHIKGLASLLKKTNIVLLTAYDVFEDIRKKIITCNYHILDLSNSYFGVDIDVIPLSHDVSCYSYVITYESKTLVYITDTGYLNKKIFPSITNKDIYIIEANHDEKMLMDGPYPYILKQRIIGDRGHLSNMETGRILSKIIGKKTKYVFLAHISEHNNTKSIAIEQVEKQLLAHDVSFDNLLLTDQYVALEMVEV